MYIVKEIQKCISWRCHVFQFSMYWVHEDVSIDMRDHAFVKSKLLSANIDEIIHMPVKT